MQVLILTAGMSKSLDVFFNKPSSDASLVLCS